MQRVGITGTRKGMTDAQRETVLRILTSIRTPIVLHHGDCVGADIEMHDLVRRYKPGSVIHIHPATDKHGNPIPRNREGDVEYEAKPPLDRNWDIVRAVELMIATPKEYEMKPRGGTWATVRYSRKAGHDPIVVLPDGSTEK